MKAAVKMRKNAQLGEVKNKGGHGSREEARSRAPEKLLLAAEGFGFRAEETGHHFLVSISATRRDDVVITEHFSVDETEALRELNFSLGRNDSNLRVVLSRSRWEQIAEPVQAEFNRRLRKTGLTGGEWRTGRTALSRLLGKELVLLCWAIEEADPTLIPTAIRNWQGLMPEERWWLYTMTNAATGHAINGRGKGWRKAVRFALTENPVLEGDQITRSSIFKLIGEESKWVESDDLGGKK